MLVVLVVLVVLVLVLVLVVLVVIVVLFVNDSIDNGRDSGFVCNNKDRLVLIKLLHSCVD